MEMIMQHFWNACGEDFFIREGEDSQNIEQHHS